VVSEVPRFVWTRGFASSSAAWGALRQGDAVREVTWFVLARNAAFVTIPPAEPKTGGVEED
jgi:hypothetical protein